MGPKRTVFLVLSLITLIGGTLWVLAQGADVSVLNPRGLIAAEQKSLIFVTVLLMAIILIPVYVLAGVIAWRYRAHMGAPYEPNHTDDVRIEALWWGVPILIIATLGVITWRTTHSLDPWRPIMTETHEVPLVIQAVALDWKWLFIYPEQGIATVNFVQIPADTPVRFDITSDAAMNAFWIPSLGSQIYAMAGMRSQLHLQADGIGEYAGLSSNFSGPGFAGMKFTVQSVTRTDFDMWAASVRGTPRVLDTSSYTALAVPSENNPTVFYGSVDPTLYNSIVLKYLDPSMRQPSQTMSGHDDRM